MGTLIRIQCLVNVPVKAVWEYWTSPEHVVQWNNASDDWCTPAAQNDLRVGGSFLYRMESVDGETGFDFMGAYTHVEPEKRIAYTLDDGRKVSVEFLPQGQQTLITEKFEAEGQNSVDLQKAGWQSILDNFKRYAEEGANR